MMPHVSRRSFLKKTLLTTGGTALLAGNSAKALLGRQRAIGRPLGANDRIRLGVAGINGQGSSHISAYSELGKSCNVEIAYLIDPDTRLFESRVKIVEEKGGYRPSHCIQDVRYALDDRSLDALSIATPNHWHSLMTIWACQAGKDVHVEKPLSHNMHEGRIAVETARRYDRIVQHGTQNRSMPHYAKVISTIHSGRLGKLLVSRSLCYKSGYDRLSTRGDIGYRPHQAPPEGFDFNIWLGPAPQQAYHENLVHYRWHWFWDFGNGDLGNQGVHEVDTARWAIAGATLPRRVISFGGRLGHSDQGETASTQVAVFDFGETQMISEVRGLPSKPFHDLNVGNIYYLEAGRIEINTRGYKFFPQGSKEPAPLPDVPFTLGPGGDQQAKYANFLAAVRSHKVSDLNADILEGHYSAALVHLANASIRLGGKVPFKPRPETLTATPEMTDVLERTESYLAENGLDLDQDGYTLGRELHVDPITETVLDDPQANDLLTRHYRKPFVVPDQA